MVDASPVEHPAAVPQVPDTLGPYEIRGVLGSGGLGTVYRAWDERLQREVALKVLAEGAEEQAASLVDLQREARLLASVSHPAVVGIFDVGEDKGRRYVAAELLDGVTLRQRMGGRPLPWRTATAIVLEAAKGLAAAHASGIVHLDLKPENLFVLARGGVKIVDFGLARRAAPRPGRDGALSPEKQESGRVLAGSVAYLTPEQVAGRTVDARSDIFSLGSVLFEALTGHAPFQRSSVGATLDAIVGEAPVPATRRVATTPAGLERIVERCLSKDPGRRFQTAYDLAFALSEQLAQVAAPRFPRSRWTVKLGYFMAGVAAALGCLLVLRLLAP